MKSYNLSCSILLVISTIAAGADMNELLFDGEQYNDDRLFVLIVAKCTIRESDEYIRKTIYHGVAPQNHKWCVVTFRNVERYRGVIVDDFSTKREAETYLADVEPQTPLISLGGNSPSHPMSIQSYSKWKKENNFKEYDYREMFPDGVNNPSETLTQIKGQ